jgi:hypothetical protein
MLFVFEMHKMGKSRDRLLDYMSLGQTSVSYILLYVNTGREESTGRENNKSNCGRTRESVKYRFGDPQCHNPLPALDGVAKPSKLWLESYLCRLLVANLTLEPRGRGTKVYTSLSSRDQLDKRNKIIVYLLLGR